jgi:predicted dehydrogenase
MKISIIGAGRTRNGIGEYIGKYFHQHGGKVTSVLGTTDRTSLQASLALRKYGIEAHPYVDFNTMVKTEKPDGAVIASPSSTHYKYLLECIDSGLHIFCEKPFIWEDHMDPREMVEEIFVKACERKLTIAMNSQWPFSIDFYEAVCGKIVVQKSNTFSIGMSPPLPGREMIRESVPHALSLLYCLLGNGKIEDLDVESTGEKEMNVRFEYLFETQVCDVFIQLRFQETPPRPFYFGLNDRIVFRSLDLGNYEVFFNYGGEKLKIVDPLELSVRNFMDAVEKGKEPFIGTHHILHNMSLLKEIDDGYHESEKRNKWKS